MNVITRCFVIVIISSIFLNATFSQVKESNTTQQLNHYVNFTNESIHGLLIVHRMLENFNKNINKYVDLPDQVLNFYSNKDLPKDIFQDDENSFYDISPNEYYEKIKRNRLGKKFPNQDKLDTTVDEMKTIISSVNAIRFELEQQINSLDLTKRENQSLVYDKLEEGVSLYKNFFIKQQALEATIKSIAKQNNYSAFNPESQKLLNALDNTYEQAKNILISMYKKEGENIDSKIIQQQSAFNTLKSINTSGRSFSTFNKDPRFAFHMENILRLTELAIADAKNFEQSVTIPDDYKSYDKYYYYYNILTITKFNRYGNGIVFEYNRILSSINDSLLRKFELPHYFKVIYPEKLEKTDLLKSSDPVITALPREMLGRTVVKANRVIKVDNYDVTFQLYDHKIIDKDIVSLSFNGDWIFENFEISALKKEFKLDLNRVGKNYLLMHAIDEGRNPPATIALSYKYKGKTETIILNSDVKSSEMIEIEVDKL